MSSSKRLMPESGRRYSLITRSDMDGLVCAVLLKSLDVIDDVTFAHPKDMQDGLIDVSPDDISANLPYVDGIYMAFDHHASEVARVKDQPINHIITPEAPSAARVIYDYFGGASAFPDINEDMMAAVDKADSADFTKDEILKPRGWVLLSFIMDARTGLGRFRDFNISNYQLMMKLIDFCKNRHNISEILAMSDVKERVDLYFEHEARCRQQLETCTQVHQNLALVDLRNEENIWAGNRFLVYALFPQCNISMHALWGRNRQNTVFAIGKSILDRSSKTHVGNLALQFGGGGHEAAGTCQIENLKADKVMAELIAQINRDG